LTIQHAKWKELLRWVEMRRVETLVMVGVLVIGGFVGLLSMNEGTADSLVWSIEYVDLSVSVGWHTSIALDSSDNPHISYMDFGGPGFLNYAHWDGLTWSRETVDSAGDVGLYTSIAMDTFDRPHISYWDGGNSDLKYARWNGVDWNIEIVDSTGIVGACTSIALDTSNRPHISYWDGGNRVLKYAHWNGTAWSMETVDSSDDVGLSTSIALDSSDNPHISYYDLTNWDLKHARWNGLTWSNETVDSAGIVGQYTSVALDSSDNPRISYYDETNGNLKYASWNGLTWSRETVDSAGVVGQYTSIALDSSNNPHISYWDETNSDLRYAHWNGTAWSRETVDSSGEVGLYTSIALDSSDNPRISYYGYPFNSVLKYARGRPNTPPTALFTVTPIEGNIATTFNVDASGSSDLEHSTPSLEVRWDWEDDGMWDTTWSTTKTSQRQYPSIGTYTIRLEVRDSGGLTDQTTKQVWVNNTPPSPSFATSPTSGNISTIFTVNASSSSDLEDPLGVLEVRWDWEDDGTWDTTWSTTKTSQHQYLSIGTYTIRLEVRDTGGLADQTTEQVWVNNTSPMGLFIATPNEGNITTAFNVDASASSDLEDAASSLEVRWDWEDDGIWDTSWSTTKTAQHMYSMPGVYTIRLEIRDTGGMIEQTTKLVWVNNTSPRAFFAISPASGNISTILTVNASSSFDLEDSTTLLEVRWDWEDDGTWDTTWSTTKTSQHQYLSIGTYTIRLEVRDTGGLADQTTEQVWVNNTPPRASFTIISATSGDVTTVFALDASSCSDLEDSSTLLEVRWDWEDDGMWDTSWSTMKAAQYKYPKPGTYAIRLEVRDSGGMTNSTTKQVTVLAEPQFAWWIFPLLIVILIVLILSVVSAIVIVRRKRKREEAIPSASAEEGYEKEDTE
jgi:PKD repeat protein